MRYDEFRAAFDAVQQACLEARLNVDGLAAEVDRLTVLRDQVEFRSDREQAASDVASLADLLEMARRTAPPPASPEYELAYREASAVAAEANGPDGSAAERVQRIQRAIKKISKIADRVSDPGERVSLLRMNEPLAMLAGSLQHTAH